MAASAIILWFAMFFLFISFTVGVGWLLVFWGRLREKKRAKLNNLDPSQRPD